MWGITNFFLLKLIYEKLCSFEGTSINPIGLFQFLKVLSRIFYYHYSDSYNSLNNILRNITK